MNKIVDHLRDEWYRYTLEIIVVILGILIAFSLSNWNDERKARALEQDYYCKLLEDINQDFDQIQEHIRENDSRIDNSNKLIQLLQSENPSRVDVANIQRLSVAKTGRIFKPGNAAFDDLKSSGSLSILKDQKIKDQLIDYYSAIEGIVDVLNVNSEYALDIYYNPKYNFADLAWYHVDYVQEVVDTTLVNQDALDQLSEPIEVYRKDLLSDAVFYLKSNARKKNLYADLKAEVKAMQGVMDKKCRNQ